MDKLVDWGVPKPKLHLASVLVKFLALSRNPTDPAI
jgi:hypothetical protein